MKWLWLLPFSILIIVAVSGREDANRAASRFMEGASLFSVVAVLVIIAIVLIVFAFKIGERGGVRNRTLSGTYRMVKIKLRNGKEAHIVPDQIYGAGVIVDKHRGTVEEIPVTAPHDLYTSVRMAVQKTRTVQAVMPPPDAYPYMNGRIGTPAGQVLRWADRPDRMAKPTTDPRYMLPVDDDAAGAAYPIQQAPVVHDFPRLVAQATGYGMLLGGNDEGLAEWDMHRDPHLAVYGKSRTGKTRRIGLNVAAQQAKRGWRVIVFDPEGGKDWSALEPHVQVVRLTPDVTEPMLQSWLSALQRQYSYRSTELSKAGVGSAYHLPGASDSMRPVVLHLEEYGRLRSFLEAKSPELLQAFDIQIEVLAMQGASRAMHLVTYTQLPVDMPKLVASNLSSLTFRQGVNKGNTVGFWHAHELGDGEFAWSGERYRSFDCDVPALRSLLAPTQPLAYLPVGQPNQPHAGDGYDEPAAVWREIRPFSPSSAARSPESIAAEKRRIIEDWRRDNPNGTQAQFRQWAETNGVKIARSWVSDVFNGIV